MSGQILLSQMRFVEAIACGESGGSTGGWRGA
jgi:hypothetical protein